MLCIFFILAVATICGQFLGFLGRDATAIILIVLVAGLVTPIIFNRW